MMTLLPVALLVAAIGCTARTQQFASDDGAVTATLKVGSNDWKITAADGTEPVADYDSMRVVEVGDDGHPATVVYYKGHEQHLRQYYSNMQLRGEGMAIDGHRQGRWVFYHSDGLVQSECSYLDGLEEGPYRVYREGGSPYYVGRHHLGKPVGTWEFYDPEGNLAGTKEYGE